MMLYHEIKKIRWQWAVNEKSYINSTPIIKYINKWKPYVMSLWLGSTCTNDKGRCMKYVLLTMPPSCVILSKISGASTLCMDSLMRFHWTLCPFACRQPLPILYPVFGILVFMVSTASSSSLSDKLLYVRLVDNPSSCIRKIVLWLTPSRLAIQDTSKGMSMSLDSSSSEKLDFGQPRPPSLLKTQGFSWERAAWIFLWRDKRHSTISAGMFKIVDADVSIKAS